MEYIKPEIIDLDARMAGGAPCNQGPFNYTSGCTRGYANSTACARGNLFNTNPGCVFFGGGAQGNCFFGWSVQP